MIVYKLTDRIPVKIGELTFWLAPLSVADRAKLLATCQLVSGTNQEQQAKAAVMAFKMSIKGIEGLKLSDGSDYKPEFDESGELSDECAEDLIRIQLNDTLLVAVMRMAGEGVKAHEIQGVEIDLSLVKSAKKK